jgi:hypothetical protein
MKDAPDNLNDLLAAVADGRLDALTPEQVARLEAHLNSDSAAAKALGAAQAGAPAFDMQISVPTTQAWERVWRAIESATAVSPIRKDTEARRVAPLRRVFRLWQPLAAAAACVLMIGSWLLLRGPVATPNAADGADINAVNSLYAPNGDAVLVPDGDGWAIVLTESGGTG